MAHRWAFSASDGPSLGSQVLSPRLIFNNREDFAPRGAKILPVNSILPLYGDKSDPGAACAACAARAARCGRQSALRRGLNAAGEAVVGGVGADFGFERPEGGCVVDEEELGAGHGA